MNLILGGTHGLGGELAQELQSRGEETFVTGRSYDDTHGSGMAVDISNESDVDELIAQIYNIGRTTLYSLSRFFWVAGAGYKGDFATQGTASRDLDPRTLARLNGSDVMPIAQAVWQRMLEQEDPADFVVISSTTGLKPRPDEAVYAFAKAGQVNFARSLRLESERLTSHIRVTLFEPGGMRTDFYEGNEPPDFETYLDPAKVAARMCDSLIDNVDYKPEEEIPRGSL